MLILIFFLILILAYWIAEKIDEDFASVVVFLDIGVLIGIVIVKIALLVGNVEVTRANVVIGDVTHTKEIHNIFHTTLFVYYPVG